MISRCLGICALWTAVLLCGGAGNAAAAQLVPSGNATDQFYALGLATNGGVRIAGSRNDEAGFFEWAGGNFTFTPLAPLLNGDVAVAQRISVDGMQIVGYSESPNTSVGYEATLWDVATPNSPVGLEFLGGDLKDSLAFGVGTSGGLIVVAGVSSAANGSTGFRWTANGGMTPLPRSGLPAETSGATGLSLDGTVWSGVEESASSNVLRAVIGTASGVTVLDSLGNSVASAVDISRDGAVVVGAIGQQATFWSGTNYAPTFVTLNGAPLLGNAIASDGAFIVGRGNNFGWIADASGVAHRISDWLLQTYGLTVTQAVVSVNDVRVDHGELFLLLESNAEDLLFTGVSPPRLEVLPPSGGLMRVRFQTAAGKSYQLLTAPSLPVANWSPVPGASLTGDGTPKELTAPLTGEAAFFRLQITTP